IDKPLPRHVRPGNGFIDSRVRRGTRSTVESLDIYLFPDQTVQVGRDIQHNDIAISHPYISRQHFVLYSIEYEEGMRPLVYVRDYNSLCGTYVDNYSTRRLKVPTSGGYLLSQGETIRLDPYWEFHVYLLGPQPMDSIVNYIEPSETNLFRDRFLITRTILGKGALAGVNLAINVETREQVACKIHRLDQFQQFQSSPSTIRRILDETNILSRLTHPNLLKFVAAFRSSNTLYTFTELATGGDLFSMRLRYPDGLSELDTKIIIRQIVEAVSYLHDHNVAHRDLKPENVFFVTGPTLMTRVIVGDFGFAKVTTSGRMASVIGTQRFMAPEVYRGESYDAKVDIWSIGMISLFLVVLDWNSLGCFEAFGQNAVDEVLKRIFDDLSGQHKALSSDFKDFVRACLIVAPPKRMTAHACKDHNWFCSSGSQLHVQIEDFIKGWEPARIIHNSVEDLKLFEDMVIYNSPSMVYSDKRKADEDREVLKDSQYYSQYFENSNSASHKRLKAVPTVPVIKLLQQD
ncbi:kinase-like domain-containing protein, partial [Nemania serpens]